MSSFKDYLAKDIQVFLNLDEFADLHKLEGKLMPVVVDESGFKEFSGTLQMENTMEGIFQSTLTIYVSASDYKKPDVGARIDFDDKYYDVVGVSELGGLLKIDLASYES